jgi:hypothetical protein
MDTLTSDQIVDALKVQADAVGETLRKFPGIAVLMRCKIRGGLILVCGTDIAAEQDEDNKE